ncbi:hypothetical protein BSKO_09965 [Bryopsis sp. KO-2023]|nr:hypothetical protein BSKO_09965 [Bryopsis sp. KO-2023]
MEPCYRACFSSRTASSRFVTRWNPPRFRKRVVSARCADSRDGFHRRRNLLLGGLGSFAWLLRTQGSAEAAETADATEAVQEDGFSDISDIFASIDLSDIPTRSKKASSWEPPSIDFSLPQLSMPEVELSSAEWLSIFSIGSSLGLGGLALKYKNELEDVQEKLENTESKLGKKEASLHRLTAENAATIDSLNSANKTIEAQKKQIQIERTEVVRLDGELDKVKIQLSSSKAEVQRLRQKLEKEKKLAANALGEARGSIESLKKKLVDSEKLSQERGLELERVQCELTGKLEEIEQATEKIAQLEFQVQSMEETLVQERERIATLEEARSSAVKDVKGLLADQRDLKFELKEEGQKVSELRATLQTREDEIAQLRPTIRETVSQLRTTSTKLSTTEHELAHLRSAHKNTLNNEQTLKQQTRSLMVDIETLNRSQESLQSTVESLEAQMEEAMQRGEMLASSVMTMEAERELLQAELDLRSKEVQGGRIREERLVSSISILEGKLAKSMETLGGVQNQLNLEKDQTEVLRWDLERRKEEITKTNQQAENLGNRLQRLEVEARRLAGVEEQLGLVTREAEEVQTKLAAAERDSRELRLARSKLKEAEANLRAIREELLVVQNNSRGELRKVKMQLSESQADVKQLKKKLSIMKVKTNERAAAMEAAAKEAAAKEAAAAAAGPPQDKDGAKDGQTKESEETDLVLSENIRQELIVPEKNQLSELIPNKEMEELLGAPGAARAVASVRAEAVMLLEEIENHAFEAIKGARKKAEACEKAAMDGLMKATAAGDRADRLQKSVDSLRKDVEQKESTIKNLKKEVSAFSARARKAESEVLKLQKLSKEAAASSKS